MKWKLLSYFYPNEAWGDPEKMDFMLLVLLDKFRGSLPNGCKVKIHRGYSDKNPKSLHYLAKAVDFRVIGCGFVEAEYHLRNYLIRNNLMKEVEYGIYPDWIDPGFHLGIQKDGGTWCGRYVKVDKGGTEATEQRYFGYKEGLAYAKRKFQSAAV